MGRRKKTYPCPWCDAEEPPVKGYERHRKSKLLWICPVCRGNRPTRCHRAHLHEFDNPCVNCGRKKFRPRKEKSDGQKPVPRRKGRKKKDRQK